MTCGRSPFDARYPVRDQDERWDRQSSDLELLVCELKLPSCPFNVCSDIVDLEESSQKLLLSLRFDLCLDLFELSAEAEFRSPRAGERFLGDVLSKVLDGVPGQLSLLGAGGLNVLGGENLNDSRDTLRVSRNTVKEVFAPKIVR